jgi:hypothetical protein
MTESLASLSERALEDLRDVFALRDVERYRRASQLALTHDSVLSG